MGHGPIGADGRVAPDANERNPSATESKLSRGGKMAYDVCRTGIGNGMRRGRGGNLSRGVARLRRESRAMESREERKNRPSRRTGEWTGMWRASFFAEFDALWGAGTRRSGKNWVAADR